MKLLTTACAALAIAAPIHALAAPQQNTSSTSASTPSTGDVSAGTYGSATSTPNSVGVSGGGDAAARNGGSADTNSTAQFNNQAAHQRSVATARDDDERARSMSNSMALKNGKTRSRSMSIYKRKGEKPVISRETSKSP